MPTTLIAALALSAAHATPMVEADPTLPSRPTTYVVDDLISAGPVANMRELYVDPVQLVKDLKPREVIKPKVVVRPRIVVTREKFLIEEKIFFALNKADIDPQSFGLLDELAQTLTEHKEVTAVRVEGHTDSQGDDKKNLKLSQSRSESVVAYLVGKGISAERLKGEGFGETKPLVEGETEEAYAKNRRVEFVVTNIDESLLEGQAQKLLTMAEFAAAEEEARRAALLPETGTLPIVNESSSWAEITINDTKVGVVGPLTNAVVRGVPWGHYRVSFLLQNGYRYERRVVTITDSGPVIPGGVEARVSVEEGTVPTWDAHRDLAYPPHEGSN